MSPYKPRHQVACAHCRERPAENRDCGRCRQAICARCVARLPSCPRPSALVARLGRGARLRAVDPAGELAVVSSWTRKLRLWDVAARRYLDRPLEGRWTTGDGEGRLFALRRDGGIIDVHGWPCLCGEHAICAYGFGVTLRGELHRDLLPRKAISCAGHDCGSDLLALASFDELVAFRRDGERYQRIGSTRRHGRIAWIGASADRVVALSVLDGIPRLRAYRCSPGVFYPLPFYEWIGGDRPELRFRPFDDPPGDRAVDADREVIGLAPGGAIQAAPVRATLAADGRFAAVAHADSTVALHDLATGLAQVYGDHDRGICWLGIVARDQLLVSGDFANRVIARQRGEAGFARWLVA